MRLFPVSQPSTLMIASVAAAAFFASVTVRAAEYVAAFTDGDRILLLNSADEISYVYPTPLHKPDSVALSPDGQRIVYTSFNESTGFAELYLAEAPNFTSKRIGATSGYHRDPAWAPDGKRIVFALHVNSHWHPGRGKTRAKLFEEDLSTGQIRPLSTNGMCHHFPSYDPSGRSIYFTRTDCRTSWNIARLDIETGREQQLTLGIARDHQPVPSPTGNHLAFVHVLGPESELRIADPNGKHQRVLTVIKHVQDLQLKWSRDGKALFWFADGEVWRMRLSDKRPQVIRGGA